MKKLMVLLVLLLWLALAQTVLANGVEIDIQPPPWRGEFSTTWQIWEFLTPQAGEPVAPEGPGLLIDSPKGPPLEQPGYLPSTQVVVTPIADWIPVDAATGRVGIWPLIAQIDVTVDNHDPPNEFKWVWVQLVWRPQEPGRFPVVDGLDPPADPQFPVELTGQGHVPLGDDWFEGTYTWRILPNPVDERFTISGSIDVDALIIDTWCIPEPATVLLLGLGGLVLLKRKV